MKREILIKHYNDALELMERMRHDNNLRLVYRDLDLEKFADRCREMLSEEWQEAENIKIPFEEVK